VPVRKCQRTIFLAVVSADILCCYHALADGGAAIRMPAHKTLQAVLSFGSSITMSLSFVNETGQSDDLRKSMVMDLAIQLST
jgi:hypothetical protein